MCADATPVELLSCLYEAAVPESGMNFEDRLPWESVQGTLEEDTSCRTQKTVLRRKGRTEVNFPLSYIYILKRRRVNRSFRKLKIKMWQIRKVSAFFSCLTSLSNLRLSEADTAGVVRSMLPFGVTWPSSSACERRVRPAWGSKRAGMSHKQVKKKFLSSVSVIGSIFVSVSAVRTSQGQFVLDVRPIRFRGTVNVSIEGCRGWNWISRCRLTVWLKASGGLAGEVLLSFRGLRAAERVQCVSGWSSNFILAGYRSHFSLASS